MVTGVCVEETQRILSCCGIDNLIDTGRGKGSLGQALLRSLKSTHRRQDLSFFGTITRFASQSGCFMSLMNPASNNMASSSPIACLFGSEKCRRACLTGLNPFWMFRLCSAKLRGIPGMSEGWQAKCPSSLVGTLAVQRLHQGSVVPRWRLFYWGPLGGPGI